MNYIKKSNVKKIIKAALAEDIGRLDITTKLLSFKKRCAKASIIAGQSGVICGIEIARSVFEFCDSSIEFIPKVKDADSVKRTQIVANVYGKISKILLGERVALNFLSLLSGISTRTAEFVDKVSRYKVKIMDTRKTLPCLRELQKYAVRIGGGHNHRFRLDQMVLVKDNHIHALCGSDRAVYITSVIRDIKKNKPKNVKLEIEVENLLEFNEAIKATPDIIMLDNMKIKDLKKAALIREHMQGKENITFLEASGNINLNNISAYARTGVDFISLGTLTKDVCSFDLSLEFR